MKNLRIRFLVSCSFATILILPFNNNVLGQNKLSKQEQKEGWILLFDGKTTNGWHRYNKPKEASSWSVQKGELVCDPRAPMEAHGDLISDQEFQNFDLTFEWKITNQGNSGVFINVLEQKDIPTAWATGPEYQLLDIAHPDYAANDKKRSGCLYGFAPQKTPAPNKPVGKWNQSRIKQVDGKMEFYLNGVLTAEQDLSTAEWKQMVGNSGFKNFPEFGKHTKGRIGLQDWANGISFRNIKIKEL